MSAVVASHGRVFGFALAATVVFGLLDYYVSELVLELAISEEWKDGVQAAIVGLCVGLALWLLLHEILKRKRQVSAELERVAELNHTIRNSLDIIVMAHQGELDPRHREMILDCTRRIDLKLKELFPPVLRF